MTARRLARAMRRLWIALPVLAFAGAPLAPARAVDVSQLSDFENAPCFRSLSARNAAEHADAPDSAMADACDAVHGDADAAWVRLTQLWQPRTPGAAAAPSIGTGPGWAALAFLGTVLVYGLLGAPMRAAAGLMRFPVGRPRAVLVIGTALALVARTVAAFLAFALLGLPFATALGALVLLVLLVRRTGSARITAGVPKDDPAAPAPTRTAVVLADLVNDGAASAAGLLGLALMAHHDVRLLVLALVLGPVASVPSLIVLRRRLRRPSPALAGLSVALAALAGVVAVSEPLLVRVFGAGPLPAIAAAVLFGATVLATPWMRRDRAHQPRDA